MNRIIIRWHPCKDFPSDEEWESLSEHEQDKEHRKMREDSYKASGHFGAIHNTVNAMLVDIKNQFGCEVFSSGSGLPNNCHASPFVAYIEVSYPEKYSKEVRHELSKLIQLLNDEIPQ